MHDVRLGDKGFCLTGLYRLEEQLKPPFLTAGDAAQGWSVGEEQGATHAAVPYCRGGIRHKAKSKDDSPRAEMGAFRHHTYRIRIWCLEASSPNPATGEI